MTHTKQTTDWVSCRSDCFEKSSYHFFKRRHWLKVVKSVDTTKSNGYAFEGTFIPVRREMKLPIGCVLVEACGERISAYRISAEGKVLIDRCERNAMVSLIEKVAEVVNSEKEGEK